MIHLALFVLLCLCSCLVWGMLRDRHPDITRAIKLTLAGAVVLGIALTAVLATVALWESRSPTPIVTTVADTPLAKFRRQYPQYNDLSDADLAEKLYRKFYADMPREEFNRRIGLTEGAP